MNDNPTLKLEVCRFILDMLDENIPVSIHEVLLHTVPIHPKRVSGYLWELIEKGHVKMINETMFLRAIPQPTLEEWKNMKLEGNY